MPQQQQCNVALMNFQDTCLCVLHRQMGTQKTDSIHEKNIGPRNLISVNSQSPGQNATLIGIQWDEASKAGLMVNAHLAGFATAASICVGAFIPFFEPSAKFVLQTFESEKKYHPRLWKFQLRSMNSYYLLHLCK
jgi:hypothetical protein